MLDKTIEIGSSLKTSSRSGVIQEGVLNLKLLEAIQAQARKNVSDREIQAQYRNALVEVINWHWSRNEWNAAEERLDQYLQFEPESFEARLLKASIYVKKGEYRQAETILLQLGVKNPDSADLNYLLGMTYYMQDKNETAYRYLKKSLAIGFRPDVDQLLKKIENENRTENEYKQSNSLHFVVRYEGTDSNRMLVSRHSQEPRTVLSGTRTITQLFAERDSGRGSLSRRGFSGCNQESGLGGGNE